MDAVKVMIHGVPAHHQVADVQIRAEGACDAGIHQMGHAEAVAQNLCAQSRIDLAHTALHHRDGQPLQNTVMEGASGLLSGLPVFHDAQQGLHLLLHGADDS